MDGGVFKDHQNIDKLVYQKAEGNVYDLAKTYLSSYWTERQHLSTKMNNEQFTEGDRGFHDSFQIVICKYTWM